MDDLEPIPGKWYIEWWGKWSEEGIIVANDLATEEEAKALVASWGVKRKEGRHDIEYEPTPTEALEERRRLFLGWYWKDHAWEVYNLLKTLPEAYHLIEGADEVLRTAHQRWREEYEEAAGEESDG